MLWDSQEWREIRNKKLLEWFCGNQAAVDCFMIFSNVSEVWDDLYDGDKAPTRDDANAAFVGLLVGLDLNPFYIQHKQMIWPVVTLSINAWLDSVVLESGVEKERMLAFYIRNYGAELVQLFALILGGWNWMRKVSPEIRQFLNHESYSEWEHRHEI